MGGVRLPGRMNTVPSKVRNQMNSGVDIKVLASVSIDLAALRFFFGPSPIMFTATKYRYSGNMTRSDLK